MKLKLQSQMALTFASSSYSSPNTNFRTHPPDTLKMAATAKTLATTELVEMILLNCGVKGIIKARCISKTFYNTIKASPQLQRKLFFKQQKQPPQNLKLSDITFNPVLYELLDQASERTAWNTSPLTRITEGQYWGNKGPLRIELHALRTSELHLDEMVTALQEQYESWQDMYVMDVPCTIAIRAFNGSVHVIRKKDAKLGQIVKCLWYLAGFEWDNKLWGSEPFV